MLRDPNFNLYDLYQYNKNKGLYFSTVNVNNPIDGRKIEAVLGVTDLSHPVWADASIKEPVRIFMTARHSEGIYFGFPMSEMLDMSPTDYGMAENCDFDLSTGMWYNWQDTYETAKDIDSDKPLDNGKPRPRFSSLCRGYGLADNITQILKHYIRVVSHPEFDVVLHIRHLNKNTISGMRWHKQGKYLGSCKHKNEYIGDDNVDSLLQYQFYVLK